MLKKKFLVLTTILFLGFIALTNLSVNASTLDYDYLQPKNDYANQTVGDYYEKLIAGTETINQFGLTTATKSGANNDFRAEIINDSTLNRNVLSLRSRSETSSSSTVNLKTGVLAPTVTDGTTGNSTALHLSFNFANPKDQVFYMAAFVRQGGLSSGSIKNIGNVLHAKYTSGEGTDFYFGDATFYTAGSPSESENEYKKFEDFSVNTWYDFVLVFNDNGDGTQDSIDYYVNGEHMFTKVGIYEKRSKQTDPLIPVDFNQNIGDAQISLQAKDTVTETNTLLVSDLYTTAFNPATSITATAPVSVTEGETFTSAAVVTGEDANYLPTFSQYDVELSSDALAYNEATKEFTAGSVEEATNVVITYKLRDSQVGLQTTQTVTVEPTVEDILPTDITRQVLVNDFNLLPGEALNLDALFTVLPDIATDQTMTYSIKEANEDVARIENNHLIGVAAGTVTLVATANGDTTVTEEVTVTVEKGVFTGINDFQLGTTWTEPNPTDYKDGWAARNYGSKVYGTIETTTDAVFGVVPVINGAGETAHAGGSYIEHFVSADDLVANKDYRIRGYFRLDGTALGNFMRADIKALVKTTNNDGDLIPVGAQVLPHYTLSSNSNLSGTWVYFETDPINLDSNLDASGISIELHSYNNNEGANIQFAHLGLVEEDTVTLRGITVLNESNEEVTSLSFNLDETYQLVPGFTPSAATADVTFTSSNELVVTVDENGLLTTVGAGVATITAKAGMFEQTVEISVQNPLTSITTDETDVTLTIGTSDTVELTFNPTNYTDELEFTFSDGTIADYVFDNNTLTITGKTIGVTTLTIASKDNSEVSLVLTITVTDVAVTDVQVKKDGQVIDSVTLTEGEEVTLTGTVSPITRLDKTITWVSSDEAVFTVSNGVITAVGAGSATLTATSGDVTEIITVTVEAAIPDATGITVTESSVDLKKGETAQISAALTPAEAEGTITYTSSNETIVTVDATGKITANAKGEATIIVAFEDFSETITVTVTEDTTEPGDETDPVTEPGDDEDNNSTLWITVGSATLGLVLVGIAIVFVKRKK
jgi:uncharacterized protein YjdB